MTVVIPDAAAAEQAASVVVAGAAIRANFPLALGLSTLAGLSTGLGALVVVLFPEIPPRRLVSPHLVLVAPYTYIYSDVSIPICIGDMGGCRGGLHDFRQFH